MTGIGKLVPGRRGSAAGRSETLWEQRQTSTGLEAPRMGAVVQHAARGRDLRAATW